MSVGLARLVSRLGVLRQGMIACAACLLGIAVCALALGNAGNLVFLPLAPGLSLWLAALLIRGSQMLLVVAGLQASRSS